MSDDLHHEEDPYSDVPLLNEASKATQVDAAPVSSQSKSAALLATDEASAMSGHSLRPGGEVVVGEDEETEEDAGEEEKRDSEEEQGDREGQPFSSTALLHAKEEAASGELASEETRPCGPPTKRRSSTEVQDDKDRLERQHQQRRALHTYNHTVRDALLSKLQGRLAAGKAVCDDVHAYLRAQAALDADYTARTRQNGEQLAGRGKARPDPGTLPGAVEGLRGVAIGSGAHLTTVVEVVRTDLLPRLQKLSSDLDKRSKAVMQDVTKATKALAALVDKVNLLYRDYQLALIEATAGHAVDHDPYIAGRQFEGAAAELRHADTLYGETLQTLLQEVACLDKQRVDELQSVLRAYIQARVSAFEGVLRDLQTTTAGVEAVSSDDFLVFTFATQKEIAAMRADADLSPFDFDAAALSGAELLERQQQLPTLLETVHAAMLVCEIPSSFDCGADVVREGWLKVKGRILKANKPVFVQLTRCGFLHFFLSEGSCVPETTVALVRCEVETAKDEFSFCVQVKRPGIGMQVLGKEKHTLQADSQDVMVEWICAIKDYTQDAHP